VDGELPPADEQAVARHLDACRPCRGKVAAERSVRALVQAHRPHLGACAPPALKARCALLCARSGATAHSVTAAQRAHHTAHTWRSRLAPFALAASLVLLVGGAFLYQATRNSARVMAAELTADHIKCFRVNAVLGTQHTSDTVEAAMASGFGWNMHLPSDVDRDGLNLVGSRPCLYGEGKVAHIMYTHDGQPVSLFMLPRENRQDQLIEVFGHQCRIWSDGNRTFVLVARETASEMDHIKALMSAAIR
jgi:anti-sigma factor RsiW